MKIVFICGSLEPGRDGVGDYTRRLAGELTRQGHKTVAIALNDKYSNEKVDTMQEVDGIEVPVLRLPSTLTSKERSTCAKQKIQEINPEWLSLQFVPFSFHSKGLPFRLTKVLSKLGEQRRWHIMFHELWVGMDEQASKKLIYWGAVQRYLIKSLIKVLKPAIIHTQTRLYQVQLAAIGAKAEYLPLFSNIPKVSSTGLNAVLKKCQTKIISFLIFGSIHPHAPTSQFIKDVALYAAENDLQVSLTIMGHCGREQECWAAVWQRNGLPVKVLGEQSPDRISEVLSAATIGISTTPFALVEKSGSVAAMKQHNLPVLCVARSWSPRGVSVLEPLKGVVEYTGNIRDFFLNLPFLLNNNSLSGIADQFIHSLSTMTQYGKFKLPME